MRPYIDPAEVVLTETGDALLDLLRENVEANRLTGAPRRVAELRWGNADDAAALEPPFDFIVGSDLVYYRESFPLLVDTLVACSDATTTVVICNEVPHCALFGGSPFVFHLYLFSSHHVSLFDCTLAHTHTHTHTHTHARALAPLPRLS